MRQSWGSAVMSFFFCSCNKKNVVSSSFANDIFIGFPSELMSHGFLNSAEINISGLSLGPKVQEHVTWGCTFP